MIIVDPVHLSIVIPVYDCAPCLRVLIQQLEKHVPVITKSYEIIFVDDRGHDSSWEILQEIHEKNEHIVLLKMSRNFGQHAAITAGLTHSRGDWVVIMDCDLQDPPKDIIRFYKKAQEGNEVVYGRRVEKEQNIFRKVAARAYSKFLHIFSEVRFDQQYGNFTIISRTVVKSFLALRDQDRHYLHILYWLGFTSSEIPYTRDVRYSGKSSYSSIKLIKHALSGIFFQTTIFLKVIIFFGFLISATSVCLALYYIHGYFLKGSYPGWTSLAVLILMIGGVIITCVGICGLYIGRIFDQVKNRPIFIIEQKRDHRVFSSTEKKFQKN